jgi:spore maturation protein CgeB
MGAGSTDRGSLILYLGTEWWGSDPRALAMALRSQRNSLIEVRYEDYLPMNWSSYLLRAVRRVIRPWCAENYNEAVLGHLGNSAIDFMLVFKGMLLKPETLMEFRNRGTRIYCFYPDVSFGAHGSNILSCLPNYDCVFTTKEYHLNDPRIRSRVRDIRLVRHGFDPDVHRRLETSVRAIRYYSCDVSFVGGWSRKKERLIEALLHNLPQCSFKVWGPGWERASSAVRGCWTGRGAYGDELAIIYQCSKINLGLLSEAASDTTSGDQTTVRTWQIPAAGGFLLHEATDELRRFLRDGEEVATFVDERDLPDAVRRYLDDSESRDRIARAGHRRCLSDRYTYASAAREICEYHSSRQLTASN